MDKEKYHTKQVGKCFVVDTSVLMELPNVMSRLAGSVYIPLRVIKQLDGLKISQDPEKNKKARHASQIIEEGIKAKKASVLTQFNKIDGLANISDNIIVGAAVRFKDENPEAQTYLVTTDRNMRIAAGAYNIITPDTSDLRRAIWNWNENVILGSLALAILGITFLLIGSIMPVPHGTLNSPEADWKAHLIILGLFLLFGAACWAIAKGKIISDGTIVYDRQNTNFRSYRDTRDPVSKNLARGIDDPGKWIVY